MKCHICGVNNSKTSCDHYQKEKGKTYIVRSSKDQGVFKKGEVIRTLTLKPGEDPETLRTGLMYEVTIHEFQSYKPNPALLPVRWSEQNRLKEHLEKLHSKAFKLLRQYDETEQASVHAVGLVLTRKELFNYYFEKYTS